MKKITITLTFVLITFVAVTAQPRAIGARLTYGLSVSYQHYLNDRGFIQADLDIPWFYGVGVAGTYNWIIAQPQWGNSGSWDFYAGVGLAGGGYLFRGWNMGYAGVAGNIGLSYTFDFPLQIAIEERPILGARFGNSYFGWWGGTGRVGLYLDFYPALAIRYAF